MANQYYERLSEMNPGDLADGLAMEAEFNAIAQAFSKLPTPHTGGQGFDGPVRVGDAVNNDEAITLKQLKAAVGEAVLLDIAIYGNLSATAWSTLPSNNYVLYGTGAQFSNTPYTLVAGAVYTLNVRHVIGAPGVNLYHDTLSLFSITDPTNVDLRRLFVRTGSSLTTANDAGWTGHSFKRAAITALEALTPAADKMAYYTSAGAAAMATITAVARTLLDDATVGDMRDTLGLGMIVSIGSFADFNNSDLFSAAVSFTSIRVAVSAFAPTNKPPSSANWWYTMVYPRATGGGSVYFRQTALSVITGETYERVNTSTDNGVTIATFGKWYKVYAQDGILGAVSQSGGVPSGAVLERGSNANGEYLKLADGTLICTASRALVYTGSSAMLQDTWTLPAPHATGIGVGMMMAQLTDNGTRKYNRASPSGGVVGSATTSVIMRLWATGTDTFISGDTTTPLPFLFIGRWY